MLLRLENCDSETVSNETDPGDSLHSALASLSALVSAMDRANRYNCVIFKIVVQPWWGRWEAVTESVQFCEASFTKEDWKYFKTIPGFHIF